MPRLRLGEQPERVERTNDCRGGEQQGGADAELQRRGAERATGGGAELDVGGRLEGEQGADEQKEGNRECLHRTPRNWTQRPWLLGPDPIRYVGQP
jgi:hypothetical protein